MPDTNQNYVNEKEAARVLYISPRTLQRWRLTGEGPRYVKLGRLVRYGLTDLADFAERRFRTSTSDDGTTEGGVR